jgi:hypothetical protein
VLAGLWLESRMATMVDGDAPFAKLCFDASKPDAFDVVHRAFLVRLRAEPNWHWLKLSNPEPEFRPHIDFVPYQDAFTAVLLDVYWALIVEGMIAPGREGNWGDTFQFHPTVYGRKVLAEPDYQPHDPAEYLRQLGANVSAPDPTVLAYLQESLHCYARGLAVASTMMLGIAAERVFLLVCDSLAAALKEPTEQTDFQKILDRNAMKPKLDWVIDKLRQIQTPKRPPDLPEDVDIKVPGIYNLIRYQRNELGHPREAPPTVTRDDAYGYLRIFPSYYATAEKVRAFLEYNQV